MKKTLIVALFSLSLLVVSDIQSQHSKRQELHKRLSELSGWCLKNDENTSAAVLLSLSGSLYAEQDSALAYLVAEFSRRAIEQINLNRNKL